ncbi:MAG: hypothetical protein IPP58_12055 [Holophagaceae bacterium]|uniref:Uncharacterized protein n=1 Tax=Candidatus Geothrix skivensis TaxID=2954439 RepID=A0A9D7XHC0_9BACT|nr:hypothetical protein [Candidatus Geothrix skivensis]
MHPSNPANFFLLLPAALALGWYGSQTAHIIHHTKGSRGDRLTVLILGWFPLLSWLLALLVWLVERQP